MPAFKITCPDCGATLKSAGPMPPGKKVKCPKCGMGFAVPDEEPPAARPKPAAKKAAPAPAPNQDEDVGTYAVIREPEDDRDEDDEDEDEDNKDRKPDLTFALDTSIKDPRGPAQEAVVRPTNWMILVGGIAIILYVGTFIWAMFPFLFSEHFISDGEMAVALNITRKEDKDAIIHLPEEKDWTAEQRARVEETVWAAKLVNFGILGTVTFFSFLTGIAIFGAVKMQTMESWGWGLAGTILMPIGCLPVFGTTVYLIIYLIDNEDLLIMILVGLLTGAFLVFSGAILLWTVKSLQVLLDPKVKEGFEHEAKEAKKRF